MGDSIRELWERTGGKERGGWVLVLVLLLASFSLVPLARGLDPQLAAMAYLGHDNDPWGNPWYVHRVKRTPNNAPSQTSYVFKPEPGFQGPKPVSGETVETYFYSLGPNGVDEKGAGDDILAEEFPQNRFPLSGRIELGRVLLPGVAAVLALLLVGFRCARAPRSARLRAEMFRAVALAAVPILAVTLFAYWDVASTSTNRRTLAEKLVSDRVLAPPSVALVSSVALFSLVLALWWRLRGDPPPPDMP
ncbi:MAG: hypothetical protein JKY65_02190 [Planctomycetes bacterium]|nr:hypothetical protein [Planctomycetota bacterium]